MATYTIRGTSHNIVYTYKTIDGKRKQQWESYSSELEAIQRKAYIDYLQAQNRASDITHEAAEYRRKKAIEKTAQKIAAENSLVTAHAYDISYFPQLKEKYNVMSVPCLVVNNSKAFFGKKNLQQLLDII